MTDSARFIERKSFFSYLQMNFRSGNYTATKLKEYLKKLHTFVEEEMEVMQPPPPPPLPIIFEGWNCQSTNILYIIFKTRDLEIPSYINCFAKYLNFELSKVPAPVP